MAKKPVKKAPKGTGDATFTVDFTKETSEGGGRRRYAEGDYRVKVVGIKTGKAKSEAQTPYAQLALEFQDGKYKGTVWDSNRTRVYISDAALWRVRSLYEACGKTVPKKKLKLDFNKLIGEQLGITVTDGEPYEGKIQSEISDFIEVDAIGGADDDDEDEEEDDDEDEDDDDEVELEDDDEL
jgi:hypothetical protein